MLNILYVLYALLLFGFIVITHEFGHFIVGRLCGLGVEEFSVGFGPKLFGHQGKHTLFSVRLLPFGGYCRFVGEEQGSDRPDAMNKQSVWKRIATVFAGPFMNFVLAYLAIFVFLTVVGVYVTVPVVGEVYADTPAQIAGMQAGDVITAIDAIPILRSAQGAVDLKSTIEQGAPGQAYEITVDRNGEAHTFLVTPEETSDGRLIGIGMGADILRYSPFPALRDSFVMLVRFMQSMLEMLRDLFRSNDILSQTSGPVGVVSVMSQEIRQGFDMVLNMILLISLNLGIMNLLPFPALDGGRIVLLLIEAVRRKPLNERYEGWLHAAGFVFLFGIIIIATYQDIARLITGG